ncbi:hypothetical protein HY636_02415 [Candidatus Woesearchaeota archaeon]|nr:hypothetical protein [Candidatus Woesearchaeota archaeon]
MEETKIETKGIDFLLEGIDAKRVLVFVQEHRYYGLSQETAKGIAYGLSRKGCEAKVIVQLADFCSSNYDDLYVASFDDSGATQQNAVEFLKNMLMKSVDAIVYVVGVRVIHPHTIAENYKGFVDRVGVEKVFLCLDTRKTDSLISTLDAIEKESQRTGKDYTPRVLINTNFQDNERLMVDEALLHH